MYEKLRRNSKRLDFYDFFVYICHYSSNNTFFLMEGDKRIGNQFWKLRSKHGRNKLFATPELLWEAACEYFEWCDENPWVKTEATIGGKYEGVKSTPTERPYTIHGLCLYLDCNTKYFSDFKRNLPEGEIGFSEVITRIEQTIYKQKFEGAAVGAFNANIIARDLGLSEKIDQKNTHEGQVNIISIGGKEFEI